MHAPKVMTSSGAIFGTFQGLSVRPQRGPGSLASEGAANGAFAPLGASPEMAPRPGISLGACINRAHRSGELSYRVALRGSERFPGWLRARARSARALRAARGRRGAESGRSQRPGRVGGPDLG